MSSAINGYSFPAHGTRRRPLFLLRTNHSDEKQAVLENRLILFSFVAVISSASG
jgi:hypothetical protein